MHKRIIPGLKLVLDLEFSYTRKDSFLCIYISYLGFFNIAIES